MIDKRHLSERIRAFEKKLQANMRDIYCPTHLSLGHESVAVEIGAYIKPKDWLFSTHRNHHHYIAKGGSEDLLWKEIMGEADGLNKGFAGSQGITDRTINFHASAIVGGLIGVAAGVAFAVKLDGGSAVAVCCVGDAASEQGVFWETLNFAALNSLPLIFVCENNGKSVDAQLWERQTGSLTNKVKSFEVAVFETVEECFKHTREGNGPSFTEQVVKLECAHLNMATMLDLCDNLHLVK
jgi:TPP-dependent pyruvate/acetoin dehydrogenase alpha subunit